VRRGFASSTQHTSTNAALGIVAVSDSEPMREQHRDRAVRPTRPAVDRC
jgi:hypothetical protein